MATKKRNKWFCSKILCLRVTWGLAIATLVVAGGSPSVADPVKKSLLFGIDGLGFGTQGFGVASTPFMDSLIDGTWQTNYQGAYSDNAYTGGTVDTATEQGTWSGPGWSTMLSGVWRDRHGVNTNNPAGGGFNKRAFEDNPIYLATLKDSIPTLSTASYVNWAAIEDRIIVSVALDDNPGNDLNFHESYSNGNTTAGFDDEVIDATLAGLGDVDGLDPDAVFVSIDLVDYAGHHKYQGLPRGSSGAGYKKAIEEADVYLGQVLGAIANRPDFLNEDWQIVVTSDHGHRAGGGHGGQTALERTIPLIVASQNLIQGDLPLGASQVDIAPTILNHFGVASPSRYAGVSRAGGAITLTGDYNHDGFVNAADYTLWRDTLGQSIASGTGADGNNNGVIDMADYTFWKGNFGNISGNLTATNAVPEPATAVLGLLGLVGLAGVARRASRSAA